MIIERIEHDALFQTDGLTPELADTLGLNDVLTHVFNHVQATFMHPMFDTTALYYPQLDAILQRVSEKMYEGVQGWEAGSGLQLIVGSKFSNLGGHSRVAKNFAQLAPRNLVVITDPYDQSTPDERREMVEFFAPLTVLFIPAGDLGFKAEWLRALILQVRPDYTSLFNHHVDPVPIVATAASPVPRRIYVHHCDYRPSLGASMTSLAHVDFNDAMVELCTGRCGAHAQLVDLYDTQLPKHAVMPRHAAGRPLNTVSAGGASKFQFNAEFSPLSLPHVVAGLLQAGEGVHHHFGHLGEQHQAWVRAVLAQSGIDPARFVCHGNVPSIQQALLAIENPVFMPSFPVGGYLMIVEVMSAGVPVLLNTNARPLDSHDFLNAAHTSLMPPGYRTFTALADIAPALQAIAADYEGHARASNARFEERHSQTSFLAGLEQLRLDTV
jgi:hypothetical protein